MAELYGEFKEHLQSLFDVINSVGVAHLKVVKAIRAITDHYGPDRHKNSQKLTEEARKVLKKALDDLEMVSISLSKVRSHCSS